MHCVALTEDGEVYGWGRSEQGQLGETTANNRVEPTLLPGLEGKNIIGGSCGPAQVISINNRMEPTLLPGLEGKNIIGGSCGPAQVRITTGWNPRYCPDWRAKISLGVHVDLLR